MATVNFVPYQDPENVSNPEPERLHVKRRAQAKSFMQDNMTHATPRKALGDVKNVKVQQSGSAIKALHQSARKSKISDQQSLNSNCFASSNANVSRQLKSNFSVKKEQKNEFKVYQESKAEEEEKSVFKEKEIMYPFIAEDFDFELPDYLNTVLHGEMKRSAWWPSFEDSVQKSDRMSYDFDLSSLQLEDLPPGEEPIWDAFPEELTTLQSPVFQSLDTNSENLLTLEDLEDDLNDIDAFCHF